MSLGWLTLAKASLAIAILGLVVARLRPLQMIAVIGPTVVAETLYICARWCVGWEDDAVLFALLVATGQMAWFVGAAILFAAQRRPPD